MAIVRLTSQQSREVDRFAIEHCGVAGVVLMENAGRGVVDAIVRTDSSLVDDEKSLVVILCGKGNNAGDGFVIARHLEIRGITAKVIQLVPSDQLQGDAATNFRILRHGGVPVVELHDQEDAVSVLTEHAASASWLVDAMLGTGAVGEPRKPYATVIDWMNKQRARRLAVDVPSGLDCDTGAPSLLTVRADVTCTFVKEKYGFAADGASEFLGTVHVVDIGLPPSLVEAAIQC